MKREGPVIADRPLTPHPRGRSPSLRTRVARTKVLVLSKSRLATFLLFLLLLLALDATLDEEDDGTDRDDDTTDDHDPHAEVGALVPRSFEAAQELVAGVQKASTAEDDSGDAPADRLELPEDPAESNSQQDNGHDGRYDNR